MKHLIDFSAGLPVFCRRCGKRADRIFIDNSPIDLSYRVNWECHGESGTISIGHDELEDPRADLLPKLLVSEPLTATQAKTAARKIEI